VLIDIVWESTQNDIQPLKNVVQALLNSLSDDAGSSDR
jgi:uncharacterized protein with HEPN domain